MYNDYNRLCIVRMKDVMKVTYYEGGAIDYCPCAGVVSYIRGNGKKLPKMEYLILKEYEDYYREYSTDLVVGKGKSDSPLYVDSAAPTLNYSEVEATEMLELMPDYQEKFQEIYDLAQADLDNFKRSQKIKVMNRSKQRKG